MVKNIISPFDKVNRNTNNIIIVGYFIVSILLWEILKGKTFPDPLLTFKKIIELATDFNFYDDLLASFKVTVEAMFISIIISAILVYGYSLPLIKPFVDFICKLRFLTISGLMYVMTMASDGTAHNLKILLLLFGIIPFFVTSLVSTAYSGLDSLKDLCSTLNMNRWQSLLEIIIIGKIDQLIITIGQNFAIGWMMITTVEGKAMSEGGIGTLLINTTKHIELEYVFALLFYVLMFGVVSDLFIKKMVKWFFPYKQ